jgi:hypothetical protein
MRCITRLHNVEEDYEALIRWVDDSGYRMAAFSRELYLEWHDDNHSKNITELQVPITKYVKAGDVTEPWVISLGRGAARRVRVWCPRSWHEAQWQQWQQSAFGQVRARSPPLQEVPGNGLSKRRGRTAANRRQRLPCRRSWVRVPSSALRNPPAER